MWRRDIVIGYIQYRETKNRTFISSLYNPQKTLEALSHYVRIKIVNTDSKNFNLKAISKGIDYLLVDIFNFGALQFVHRQQQQIRLPFIIVLRTIFPWASALAYSIPLIRKSDIIVSPSLYGRNAFLNISSRFPVSVIPHSVDYGKIHRQILPLSRREGRKQLVFMGRLIEHKGIGTLIECMPEIISRSKGAQLNIIGPLTGHFLADSPKSTYVCQLQKRLKQLKIEKYVHFLGLKTGREKYRILSEADIFVFPSTAGEENFSIAILEAIACGLPVIAADWAANREIIEDGKNGYLLDVENPLGRWPIVNTKQLIERVSGLLKNKKELRKMKNGAFSSVRQFDCHRIIPRFLRLFQDNQGRQAYSPQWKEIRKKTPLDFKDYFRPDTLFYLKLLGATDLTYADYCQSRPLSWQGTRFISPALKLPQKENNLSLARINQDFLDTLNRPFRKEKMAL
jgi:glycosyltransferase involved in cell wall biosynthesis